jgi:hypothetical protein
MFFSLYHLEPHPEGKEPKAFENKTKKDESRNGVKVIAKYTSRKKKYDVRVRSGMSRA